MSISIFTLHQVVRWQLQNGTACHHFGQLATGSCCIVITCILIHRYELSRRMYCNRASSTVNWKSSCLLSYIFLLSDFHSSNLEAASSQGFVPETGATSYDYTEVLLFFWIQTPLCTQKSCLPRIFIFCQQGIRDSVFFVCLRCIGGSVWNAPECQLSVFCPWFCRAGEVTCGRQKVNHFFDVKYFFAVHITACWLSACHHRQWRGALVQIGGRGSNPIDRSLISETLPPAP